MTTNRYVSRQIANCAPQLVVFKFLVPKTFWSWVARTTSMLNAQKLTPSTGFAVSLIDVAVVIADRLGGWRWRRCRGRSRRGGAIQVDGGEGWHVGPLHWHHSAPDDQRLLQKREIQRRKKLQKPYARERPAIECSDILRSGIKIISGGEKGVNPEKEKSPLQGIMTVSSSQPSENIAPSLPELLQTTRIPKSVQEPSSEISVNQHSESPSHSGHDRGVSWVIQRRRETERGVAVGTPWQPHHSFQVSFAWSDRHNFGEHKLTQRNRLLVSSLFM